MRVLRSKTGFSRAANFAVPVYDICERQGLLRLNSGEFFWTNEDGSGIKSRVKNGPGARLGGKFFKPSNFEKYNNYMNLKLESSSGARIGSIRSVAIERIASA